MTNVLIIAAIILLVVVVVAEWIVPDVPGSAVMAISVAFLAVAFLMRDKG
jgi:hypothetical protein